MAPTYILDTSLLLGGREPPPGTWLTTPEARSEIRPGGRDARRLMYWESAGLRIQAAPEEALQHVEDAARNAGNLDRLSTADRSLLALAHHTGATLLSDDHTMLDVASRTGITSEAVNSAGIESTLDWHHRCTGCGRWFDDGQPECPVCGSPVRPKVKRSG